MAVNIGSAVTTGAAQNDAFQFSAAVPLDSRVAVWNLVSLVALKTWRSDQYIYDGLICCVLSTHDIYVFKGWPLVNGVEDRNFYPTNTNFLNENGELLDAYKDTSPTLIDKVNTYWTKIPSQTDLETNKKDLFSFQGVASAIDADHCTLTIGNPTLSNVTYKVWTYRVDVEGDTYMFWADASAKTQPTIGYWLRDPFQNGSMTYTLSSSKANILIYNSENYYETGTVVNDRTQYLSLDGKDIWVNGSDVYETSDSTTPLTTQSGKAETHDVYFFTEATKLTGVTQASGTGNAVQASPSNKGHVYQLGEEEYASNGTIWVQLGSPKEDWIVIK